MPPNFSLNPGQPGAVLISQRASTTILPIELHQCVRSQDFRNNENQQGSVA
jgi:hypothetical protein